MSTKKRSKKKNSILISIIAIIIISTAAIYLMQPKTISYESAVATTRDITTYYSFS